MNLWLSLYLPSRLNRDSIGVVNGEVMTSLHFPQAWLEAAKSYVPGDEALSVMAWMLAVHDGKIKVEDRIPVWSWGNKEKARAYVEAVLAARAT